MFLDLNNDKEDPFGLDQLGIVEQIDLIENVIEEIYTHTELLADLLNRLKTANDADLLNVVEKIKLFESVDSLKLLDEHILLHSVNPLKKSLSRLD